MRALATQTADILKDAPLDWAIAQVREGIRAGNTPTLQDLAVAWRAEARRPRPRRRRRRGARAAGPTGRAPRAPARGPAPARAPPRSPRARPGRPRLRRRPLGGPPAGSAPAARTWRQKGHARQVLKLD